MIHGCFNKTNGNLRVVDAAAECRNSETAIVWNQKGQQGLRGPIGPVGPKGDTGLRGAQGPQGEPGDVLNTAVPVARVHKSASAEQTIPSHVCCQPDNALSFDVEDIDSNNLHAAGGSRLTAPIDGIYQVHAGIVWRFNPAGGNRDLRIVVNGACCFGTSEVNANTTGVNRTTHQTVSDLVQLSAGDYVQAFAAQESGSPVTVGGFGTTFLAMAWVGPAPD